MSHMEYDEQNSKTDKEDHNDNQMPISLIICITSNICRPHKQVLISLHMLLVIQSKLVPTPRDAACLWFPVIGLSDIASMVIQRPAAMTLWSTMSLYTFPSCLSLLHCLALLKSFHQKSCYAAIQGQGMCHCTLPQICIDRRRQIKELMLNFFQGENGL